MVNRTIKLRVPQPGAGAVPGLNHCTQTAVSRISLPAGLDVARATRRASMLRLRPIVPTISTQLSPKPFSSESMARGSVIAGIAPQR